MSPSLDLTRARAPSTVGLMHADTHRQKLWETRLEDEGFEKDGDGTKMNQWLMEKPRSAWFGSAVGVKVIGHVGGRVRCRHAQTHRGPPVNDSGLQICREDRAMMERND